MLTGKCHWRRAFPGPLTGTTQKSGQTAEKASFFSLKKKYFFCGQVWTLSVIKLVLILYQIFQSRKLEKKCDSNRRLFSRRRLNVYAGSTRKSRYFSAIKSLFDNFFSLIIFACLFYFGLCFFTASFSPISQPSGHFLWLSLYLLNLYIALRIEWKVEKVDSVPVKIISGFSHYRTN